MGDTAPIAYSTFIERIVEWLRKSNVRVDLHALDLEHAGHFNDDLEHPVIRINVPSAKEALIVLAHEVGHWIGQLHEGFSDVEAERELQAFVYGWGVLRTFNAPITREEWNAHEAQRKLDAACYDAGLPLPRGAHACSEKGN